MAQICQALGWDSVQLSACHLLTDVLQRYLQQLGRGCHRYSELCEYRAGCGRAASGQSRVTPPVSPSPSQRLRRVRPSPLPRDRASPRPVRFHCPWKLVIPSASSSSANFPPPSRSRVPAPGPTPSPAALMRGAHRSASGSRAVPLPVEPPPECFTASLTWVLFLLCLQTTTTSCHRRSVYRPLLTRLAVLQLGTAQTR